MAGLIALTVVLALVLALAAGLWVMAVYNGLVRLRSLVQESWRQIDLELGRRRELIPGMVRIVEGYAAGERRGVAAVVAARAAASDSGLTVPGRAAAEGALSSALGRLYAVAETYPALRSDARFLALQAEFTETEDRVAAGRRFYNATVRQLNGRVATFPSSVFARVFGIGPAEYFEVVDATIRSAGPAPNR